MLSRFCYRHPPLRWAAFSLLGLALVAPVLRADFAKGLAAYKAGDFAAAHREFLESAEAGEPPAMLSLAFLYMHGEGVPVDYREAVRWLEPAAEKGLAPAQHSLALAYYEGRGVPRNTAVAANYFESAALQGLADAQYNLGVLYARGDGVAQDWARAKFWHEKAAEQGMTDSELALGAMYANGQGVARDYVEAARWFGKAAEQGNARAQRALERFGESAPAPAPAVEVARLSPAVSGTLPVKPSALAAPALVPKRNFWRKAPAPLTLSEFQALQARAVTGEAAAQLELGIHYYHGDSVKRSLLRAYVWAKRAALKGNPGGEAMSKGMYWELDEQQRKIAERLLAPPAKP
ncbi:MAG: SEL1-like repeat protein [Bryobacterales bacterium]|nr:SEL1-like repeat protein [Bryobacterales bacterium]